MLSKQEVLQELNWTVEEHNKDIKNDDHAEIDHYRGRILAYTIALKSEFTCMYDINGYAKVIEEKTEKDETIIGEKDSRFKNLIAELSVYFRHYGIGKKLTYDQLQQIEAIIKSEE